MPTLPVDIVNRALDECGLGEIGDLQEGSEISKAAIRVYEPTLRQLLSAVHWNFARKQFTMILLQDSAGSITNDLQVPSPWAYMYDWPVDCVHARFVPRNISPQNINKQLFGVSASNLGTLMSNSPSPFIVASVPIPNPIGSQWYLTEGHDPEQTRVVLSNQPNAQLIYTGMMQYPDAWDPLFEQAMVAVLASRFAMPLIKDKKEARVVRADNIAIAKEALAAARVRDGDEGWTVVNHEPDWLRFRRSGGFYELGMLWNPWIGMSFEGGNGTVY